MLVNEPEHRLNLCIFPNLKGGEHFNHRLYTAGAVRLFSLISCYTLAKSFTQ